MSVPLAKRKFLQYHIFMNVQYTLIRAKRKSIGIRVSDTGEIIVRAPKRMPAQEIEAVLQRHMDWIEKNQKKA